MVQKRTSNEGSQIMEEASWYNIVPRLMTKREERMAALRQQIQDAQRELNRLEKLAEDPGNAGTIVRWREAKSGIYYAARRQNCGQWDVTGMDLYRTWDELLDLVGHATLEIADSFSTLMRGTQS